MIEVVRQVGGAPVRLESREEHPRRRLITSNVNRRGRRGEILLFELCCQLSEVTLVVSSAIQPSIGQVRSVKLGTGCFATSSAGAGGPVAIYVGIDWRVFGRHEAIRSCGEVNDLIVWFLGEGLPSVDLAHGDLS